KLRLVPGARERGAHALGRVHLRDDARLEIEAGRHVEVAVRRPGEAVDAAVLATAIGVDRDVEVDVGRIVAVQDALRLLLAARGARGEVLLRRALVEPAPAFVARLALHALEAVRDGPRRAAPLERGPLAADARGLGRIDGNERGADPRERHGSNRDDVARRR